MNHKDVKLRGAGCGFPYGWEGVSAAGEARLKTGLALPLTVFSR